MTFDIADIKDKDSNVVKFKGKDTRAVVFFSKRNANDRLPESEVVEIPEQWKETPVCLVIIEFLKSEHFKTFNASHQYGTLRKLLPFFEFLENGNLDPSDDSRALVYPLYLNHVKKKGGIWAVYDRIGAVRQVLNWAKDQSLKDITVNGWNDNTRAIQRSIPKLDKPRSARKISMSQLFESIDHTDYALLKGLRCVSAWYLIEAKRQREYLRSKLPEVLDMISTWNDPDPFGSPFYSFPGTSARARLKKDPNINMERVKTIYAKIIKAVLDSDDALLIERLYYSKPRKISLLKENTQWSVSVGQMKREIESWLRGDGQLRISYKDLDTSKETSMHGINTVALTHFVLPSEAEETCMYWLLASDRIQATGIANLELNHIHKDEKEIQITEYEKNRSTVKTRQSVLYKRGSAIFDALNHYYDLMKDVPNYFDLGERNNFLIVRKSNAIVLSQRALSKETGLLPLQLAGFNGSHSYAKCLEEYPEAKPFLELFKMTIDRSIAVMDGNARYNKDTYDGNKGKRSEYKIPASISISADLIANSRANVNHARGNALEEDVDVVAYQSAHSAETMHNTYKDRTVTKEKILKDGKFAARVGDLMMEDAEKVRSMLEGVETISLDEVSDKLGLTSHLKKASDAEAVNSILEEAQLHDYVTSMFGEVTKESKTFIVMTPLTAALILGYINHIDDNLPRITNDNPSRTKGLQVHKAYLIEVLNRFPANFKLQAEQMLEGETTGKKVIFPYPPLV